MVIPAAMFIEEANDMLLGFDGQVTAAQRHELEVANVGPDTEDFKRGYELGLQVARVILIQSPRAVEAGLLGIL